MDEHDIIRSARRWIGTPYVHQASCRGAGADCLGLIRGIWREVIGAEPEPLPAYTADWSEVDRKERLLRAAMAHFQPIDGQPHNADVLVFRMRDKGVAKHMGLFVQEGGSERLIHAYSGHGVVEVPLGAAWRRRIAGVFRFPERIS
ncbi:NlpC/P60 family putative phage cell wall peptidase [Rubricella aquisinus]|uniref:NlpC/P60 family putative phage cell wall peptidase n=1 Tax=Rubricella aquisinus TaxID=2028108 RepID=A0A840WR74_9RHOB|nr:NlpC/P60 family protein [Rubricella aquisinus]MBB5516543.1 NlpC/P60 family putative phage cell wall peptidase [Rubricella aquisinus]